MTTSTADPPAPTQTPSPRRPFRLTTPRLALIAVIALVISGAAFLMIVLAGKDAQTQAQSVAADTAPAVLTLDVLCKRQDQLGNDLRQAGACGEKVDKAKQAVNGQAQPNVPVAGISRDDVAAIVQAQLAGKTVTVDQVMAMVIDVYKSNPPKDGKDGQPPTADQILAAVQAVCSGGKCQGPKGEAAPPASPAEIYAQVQAFCGSEGSPCRGPQGERGETGAQGDQGPQGVSVVGQAFVRNDQGACRSQVTFSDGRVLDGGPAGDAACPPAVSPPAPTP